MYGSDSDDSGLANEEGFVELKQEIVDFPTLHKREEELYFYDAFAYPWEKEKHYRMVYQLEKKYFPDQSLDKAFVEPGELKEKKGKKGKVVDEADDDKGLVFFEEKEKEEKAEKKVAEFFKCLKKVPSEAAADVADGEPYMLTRKTELPPRWDGPHGTVVLVNKPKGNSYHNTVIIYH